MPTLKHFFKEAENTQRRSWIWLAWIPPADGLYSEDKTGLMSLPSVTISTGLDLRSWEDQWRPLLVNTCTYSSFSPPVRSPDGGAPALHRWEGGERAPPGLHVPGVHQVHKRGGQRKLSYVYISALTFTFKHIYIYIDVWYWLYVVRRALGFLEELTSVPRTPDFNGVLPSSGH